MIILNPENSMTVKDLQAKCPIGDILSFNAWPERWEVTGHVPEGIILSLLGVRA